MAYTFTMEEYNEMYKMYKEGKITADEWGDYCLECLRNALENEKK